MNIDDLPTPPKGPEGRMVKEGYNCHITLSYDLESHPIPKFEGIRKELRIVEEYVEDLKLEWKPKG